MFTWYFPTREYLRHLWSISFQILSTWLRRFTATGPAYFKNVSCYRRKVSSENRWTRSVVSFITFSKIYPSNNPTPNWTFFFGLSAEPSSLHSSHLVSVFISQTGDAMLRIRIRILSHPATVGGMLWSRCFYMVRSRRIPVAVVRF